MNTRERIQSEIAHEKPDRAPFDLGSTDVTGIHTRAYMRLRRAGVAEDASESRSTTKACASFAGRTRTLGD